MSKRRMRECSICGESKIISEFNRTRNYGKEFITKWCKRCSEEKKLKKSKGVVKKEWGHRQASFGDYVDELV